MDMAIKHHRRRRRRCRRRRRLVACRCRRRRRRCRRRPTARARPAPHCASRAGGGGWQGDGGGRVSRGRDRGGGPFFLTAFGGRSYARFFFFRCAQIEKTCCFHVCLCAILCNACTTPQYHSYFPIHGTKCACFCGTTGASGTARARPNSCR